MIAPSVPGRSALPFAFPALFDRRLPSVLVAMGLLLPPGALAAPDRDGLAERATSALARAAGYFRDEVAVQGSYGWRAFKCDGDIPG
jgi:hypothetical protein